MQSFNLGKLSNKVDFFHFNEIRFLFSARTNTEHSVVEKTGDIPAELPSESHLFTRASHRRR